MESSLKAPRSTLSQHRHQANKIDITSVLCIFPRCTLIEKKIHGATISEIINSIRVLRSTILAAYLCLGINKPYSYSSG